jgi:hypothetical protein
VQPSDIHEHHTNVNNQLNVDYESSPSVERVPETPQHGSQIHVNDELEGDRQNMPNPNGMLQSKFRRFQMQFRYQIDSLKTPNMCYVCQESYAAMKVYCTSERPICNRCRQEIGIHRFSSSNNMDLGCQPQELANLTQVEEMLIARVNPILQVTHATGGQYKYKGHTISFPQHVE